jgi:hypothetical protein
LRPGLRGASTRIRAPRLREQACCVSIMNWSACVLYSGVSFTQESAGRLVPRRRRRRGRPREQPLGSRLRLAHDLGWTLTSMPSPLRLTHYCPGSSLVTRNPELRPRTPSPSGLLGLSSGFGLLHHEALFALPPSALINRFIAKARANGIRAVIVTPLAVSVATSVCVGTETG